MGDSENQESPRTENRAQNSEQSLNDYSGYMKESEILKFERLRDRIPKEIYAEFDYGLENNVWGNPTEPKAAGTSYRYACRVTNEDGTPHKQPVGPYHSLVEAACITFVDSNGDGFFDTDRDLGIIMRARLKEYLQETPPPPDALLTTSNNAWQNERKATHLEEPLTTTTPIRFPRSSFYENDDKEKLSDVENHTLRTLRGLKPTWDETSKLGSSSGDGRLITRWKAKLEDTLSILPGSYEGLIAERQLFPLAEAALRAVILETLSEDLKKRLYIDRLGVTDHETKTAVGLFAWASKRYFLMNQTRVRELESKVARMSWDGIGDPSTLLRTWEELSGDLQGHLDQPWPAEYKVAKLKQLLPSGPRSSLFAHVFFAYEERVGTRAPTHQEVERLLQQLHTAAINFITPKRDTKLPGEHALKTFLRASAEDDSGAEDSSSDSAKTTIDVLRALLLKSQRKTQPKEKAEKDGLQRALLSLQAKQGARLDRTLMRCYACGKLGHGIRDCPDEKMVERYRSTREKARPVAAIAIGRELEDDSDSDLSQTNH